MSNNSSSPAGSGFCAMLTVLFIGLKLTGFISWPWLWVLSPLWMPLLLFVSIAVVAALVYMIVKNK